MSIRVRWMCRRISPLLVPYAENALSPENAAKVKAHLDRCAECRREAALVSDMGKLLREHRPQTPEPAADLWMRIQQQIEPAPQPSAQVVRRPGRISWRSLVSLPALGSIAAAAAVLLVFASGRLMPVDPVEENPVPGVALESDPVQPSPKSLPPVLGDEGPARPGNSFDAASAEPPSTKAPVPDPFVRRSSAAAAKRTPVTPSRRTVRRKARPQTARRPSVNVPPVVAAPERAYAIGPTKSTRYSAQAPAPEATHMAKVAPENRALAFPDAALQGGASRAMSGGTIGPVPPSAPPTASQDYSPGPTATALLPEPMRLATRGNVPEASGLDPSLRQDVPATASAVEKALCLQRQHDLFRY